jgi:hypothetical protein
LLSGLDANLNKTWIPPLTEVATTRLSEATVRQAAAILAAGEHAIGTLNTSRLTIRSTAADSADLADCEDYEHTYLVSIKTGQPDPAVERGYFVGTAHMVRRDGHWYVDVYATTHVRCVFTA